jgi:coenzyme F420-reducing hydrogenase delta subunit/NAD-dependent dihydropyrimidine dehydrogenase PreA subunit
MDLPGVFLAGDGANLPDVVDQALAHLDLTRPMPSIGIAAPSQRQLTSHLAALWGLEALTLQPPAALQEGARGTQLGVFLCRCGGEIERAVDLAAVTARVEELPAVAYVRQLDFACHPEDNQVIRSALATQDLDGAVLAACSCCALDQICYSCTTQRTRCKERLGVWDGLQGLPLQFVNVREQCAFVHRDNPAAATLKAGDLVTAAAAALALASDRPAALGTVGPLTKGSDRLPITASINPVRCRGCEDCESACGLQAVQVVGQNGARIAQVDATHCLGCGICIAVCSSGAILASDTSDAQVEAMLAAMGDLSDKTVVFSCNWGAYSAVEAAGIERLGYDPSVRLMRLMCTGRAHVGLILRAFARGAARVLVLACGHEDDASLCYYQCGNDQAEQSVEQARRLLGLLGIDPARLAIVEVQPGDGAQFVAAVEEFVGTTLQSAQASRPSSRGHSQRAEAR